MINVQNEKRKNKRKIGQIAALKEELSSDKDTIYLPRQDFAELRKVLDSLGQIRFWRLIYQRFTNVFRELDLRKFYLI